MMPADSPAGPQCENGREVRTPWRGRSHTDCRRGAGGRDCSLGEAGTGESREKRPGVPPGLSLVTRAHLSESCDPVLHVRENRGLVAHLQVEVDGLVREGGKLITEAKLINTLDVSLVREAVVLLPGFPVDGVAQRVLHRAVHVVVASRDDLTTTKDTRHVCYQRALRPDLPNIPLHLTKLHNLLRQVLRHSDFTEDDSEAERGKVKRPWSDYFRGTGLRFESMSSGLQSFCSASV